MVKLLSSMNGSRCCIKINVREQKGYSRENRRGIPETHATFGARRRNEYTQNKSQDRTEIHKYIN